MHQSHIAVLKTTCLKAGFFYPIYNNKTNFNHPQNTIKAGVAYMTEDHKGNGIIQKQMASSSHPETSAT